jgi:uncharacterized protein YkwD
MGTHLIIFFFCQFWILPYTHVLAGFQACPLQAETSTQTPSAPSLVDIINAVKNLRFRHGLTPLTIHDVLMEVVAKQANALAATEGAIGHQRPCLSDRN